MAVTTNNPDYTWYAGGGGGGGTGASNGIGGGAGTIVNTTANTVWQNPNPAVTIGQSGVVQLSGFDADVVINGVSLNETLKAIQTQLNVLIPNPALEAEWDELKELGELYRKKEAELKEKKRMWDIMKRAE